MTYMSFRPHAMWTHAMVSRSLCRLLRVFDFSTYHAISKERGLTRIKGSHILNKGHTGYLSLAKLTLSCWLTDVPPFYTTQALYASFCFTIRWNRLQQPDFRVEFVRKTGRKAGTDVDLLYCVVGNFFFFFFFHCGAFIH